MRPRIKSHNCIAAALLLLCPLGAYALHTDPNVIEVGDTGSIAIPFENQEGGISPIENVRLAVINAPAWIDVDTTTSFMGPVSIFPGELMTFSADYRVNSQYDPSSPAGDIVLNLLSDSTSFVPSGITWSFSTDNGFKTMRGECVDNDGIACGSYLSPDTLAPNTYLQFDGPAYKADASKIFLSTSTLVYFVGSDAYESNAEIARSSVTGYFVGAAPASFEALNFSTEPITLSAGSNSLYFASRDYAGNTEVVKSSVVYVDALAPTVDYEIVGSSGVGANGVVILGTASLVNLIGFESGSGNLVSGMNRVMYSLDVAYSSSTAVFFGEPFALAMGAHTIYYTAFDNVENQSEVKTLNVVVGNTNVACGSVVTENTILASDLDCRSAGGNGVVMGADNITLDCQGHKIIGDGGQFGVAVVWPQYRSYVTVKNCDISNFGIGMSPGNFNAYNNLQDNRISFVDRAFALRGLANHHNTIKNNVIVNAMVKGVDIGPDPSNSDNVVENNSISRLPAVECSSAACVTGNATIRHDVVLSTDITGGVAMGVYAKGGDGVTFDCQGHKIVGDGSQSGVGVGWPQYRSYVTVKNCDISNFGIGMSPGNFNAYNNLQGNRISFVDRAFALRGLANHHNTITENTVINAMVQAIDIGADPSNADNIVDSNTVTRLPFVECLSAACATEKTAARYDVALSTDIVGGISIGAYGKGGDGVVLDCQGHKISGDASPSSVGVTLPKYRSDATIQNCSVGGFWGDIVFGSYNSRNNLVGNRLSDATYGVFFGGNSNAGNRVIGNTIARVTRGLYFSLYSGSNIVSRNNFYGNSEYSVYSEASNVELSYNNAGNYWGRTSSPYFVAGVDSNREDVKDSYPYSWENGWLVDQTPPETLLTLNGEAGRNGWYISSVHVSLTSTDELSGVAESRVCVDQSNTCVPVPGVIAIVDTEGINYLRYQSVDRASNLESLKTETIKISTSGPVGVTDMSVVYRTTGSIAVSWRGVQPRLPDVPIESYVVDHSSSPDSLSAMKAGQEVLVSTNDPIGMGYSVLIDGLPSGAAYYSSVWAKDVAGNISPGSNIVSATTYSVGESPDGVVGILVPDGVAISVQSVSTGAITSSMTVYTAMLSAGLEPLQGAFYEFEPSGVQFAVPATLKFSFDPVGVDTTTLAIYYFDGVAWSSTTVLNQRVVFESDTLANLEGEITHTSMYALLRKKTDTGPVVSVALSPSTLNLDSRGGFITAELGFTSGSGCFRPGTIMISAVNGAALAEPIYAQKPGHGRKKGGYELLCGTATVKFDRDEVGAVLPANAVSEVTVSGQLENGAAFRASDEIRTIKHFRGWRGNKWRFAHRCGAFLDGKAGALKGDLDLFMLKVERGLAWKEARKERAAAASGFRRHGSAFEFGPEGLKFEAPVTISLPYDPGEKNPERLLVAYWNEAAGVWEPLPSRYDRGARLIKADVAHFSQYQVVAATYAASAAEPSGLFRPREEEENLSETAAAQEFRLGAVYVYPDPAKGGKVPTFHIEVGAADTVKIRVYTVAGQLAHERTLTGAPQFVGGGYAYEYPWEGRIASGVYYYTIEAEKSGRKLKTRGKFGVIR